jgi:hypothetical protein
MLQLVKMLLVEDVGVADAVLDGELVPIALIAETRYV